MLLDRCAADRLEETYATSFRPAVAKLRSSSKAYSPRYERRHGRGGAETAGAHRRRNRRYGL